MKNTHQNKRPECHLHPQQRLLRKNTSIYHIGVSCGGGGGGGGGIIPPPPPFENCPSPPPPLYPQCVLGIKNTTPLFFAKPPLKSAICSSPLLLGNYPLYIGSSSTPPKNQIFQWTPIILRFFFLNLIQFFKSK